RARTAEQTHRHRLRAPRQRARLQPAQLHRHSTRDRARHPLAVARAELLRSEDAHGRPARRPVSLHQSLRSDAEADAPIAALVDGALFGRQRRSRRGERDLDMRRVFLTGAATLVGAEVLRALLHRIEVHSIALLMPADETLRTQTLQRLEAFAGPMPRSVSVITGDMRLPRFGLSVEAWKTLASSADIGIHCGQREVPDQNLELARQANVAPVENWIYLLERNPSLRLHHLSTALVGGARRGLFTEFDLDCGQRFHNAFEHSKFEAETRLRQSSVTDRVAVYRPSHVLGCAATGQAFDFGGAYPLLATIAAASILPGDARARIDFVPADHVASAIVALALDHAAGTF